MAEYRPLHRGHRCLALLRHGPADLYALYDAAKCETRSQRKKLWIMLDATLRLGFVALRAGEYRLTPFGEETLARLDAGHPVEVEDVPVARPSVRVFLKEAA